MLPRIYFDANEAPGEYEGDERYALWLQASLDDLALISDQLRDGLRVVIYTPDELEMEATLEFDETHGAWMAWPDPSTIKHYSLTGSSD